MTKKNQYIGRLEGLLTHLKNTKLEYLKAADQLNNSEHKRHLNQQAILRNRFFQEILKELHRLGMTLDNLVISRFNFDQLLISSIDILQVSAIEKCIQSDAYLLEKYNEIQVEFESVSEIDLFSACEKIKDAIEKNQFLIDNFASKSRIHSIF
ncbi:MAG: hypothetical protein VW262_04165 [Flavobacteriaceae bacterium]|jgi:hypothetical protein